MSEINLIENRQQPCNTENYYLNDQHLEPETICCISIDDHHCSNSHDIKGSVMFFINHLANNVGLNKNDINQSIENIISTTSREVLLDFDLRKPISFNKRTEKEIVHIIRSIF